MKKGFGYLVGAMVAALVVYEVLSVGVGFAMQRLGAMKGQR